MPNDMAIRGLESFIQWVAADSRANLVCFRVIRDSSSFHEAARIVGLSCMKRQKR
jgi:hypothetical protein